MKVKLAIAVAMIGLHVRVTGEITVVTTEVTIEIMAAVETVNPEAIQSIKAINSHQVNRVIPHKNHVHSVEAVQMAQTTSPITHSLTR